MPANLENSAVATGLEKVSFHSNPKERQSQRMLKLPHNCHEIKRHLLPGRKVMTNLGSILKSKDITLSIRVHLVLTMVFPVAIYGCESWTIKKASTKELMLLNCAIGEDS